MKNAKLPEQKKQFFRFDKTTLMKVSLLIVFAAILNISLIWGQAIPVESVAGAFLITALLLLILYKDFIRYKPQIKQDYKLLILIGTLLSGNLMIGRVFFYVLHGFSDLSSK